MSRIVTAIAAIAIAMGAAACSPGRPQPSGRQGTQPSAGTGTWTVASCRVDVTYLDDTTTVDYYVPDTGANYERHLGANGSSGGAALAVVITLVNHTGRRAPLPTGLVVSFTDHSGNHVGRPQTFNNPDGTGYGAAIADGHGSGEVFSASTQFSPGRAVAESPDISAVPQLPDLNCLVSRH